MSLNDETVCKKVNTYGDGHCCKQIKSEKEKKNHPQ